MIPLMGLNISCWELNLETSKRKFWVKRLGNKTAKQNEGEFFYLVGGFNPSWNRLVKMESSPNRGKHKTYLKPPPQLSIHFWGGFLKIQGLKVTLDDDRMREVLIQKVVLMKHMKHGNHFTLQPFVKNWVKNWKSHRFSLHKTPRGLDDTFL